LKKVIKQKRTQKNCHNCLQYKGVLQILYLVYFEYWQIWLNIFMYYHHLSNIMKLRGKKTYWLRVASSHFAKRQNGNDECLYDIHNNPNFLQLSYPFQLFTIIVIEFETRTFCNATESQNGMDYTSEPSPLGHYSHWEFPKPHHAWAPWAIERSIFCWGTGFLWPV
jgi:hypothetical protein